MKYLIEINEPKQLANVEAALKIVDPAAELNPTDYDLRFIIEYDSEFRVRVTAPELNLQKTVWEIQDQEILDPRYNSKDRAQRLKELIRLGVISLLGPYFGKRPTWGILSAVRPTKIFHYLRDKGFSSAEIREKLLNIYYLDPDAAELLIEVGIKQEKYFKPPHYISIYVGIPFCPSRCRYCSFPAVSLETNHHQVQGFLKALELEIAATAELVQEYGFAVESIYIGGGTPTSLNDETFAKMLEKITTSFKSHHSVEFTVEAGRPETVNQAKLAAMQRCGVNRVCINPQTMNEQTLDRIGRRHTIADVVNGLELVRRFPEFSVNMDLILGLPGENGALFLKSLQQLLVLQPDAITIHTLAPKRAAAWRKNFKNLEVASAEDIGLTFQNARAQVQTAHYYPYYLYRQRSILGDQANIGFARTGHESIYNIQMMEERQTILGLGAGAVSKWVTGSDFQVFRVQNPKCPATYSQLIHEQIVKKAQETRLLLG